MNKKNYTYIGRYRCPLLYYRLVHEWVNHDLANEHGIQTNDQGKSVYLDGHMFVNSNDWKNTISYVKRAIRNKNDQYFSYFYELADKEISNVLRDSEALSSDPKLFANYFKSLQSMQFPWMLTIPMGDAIEYFLKSVPKESHEQFFVPNKPTLIVNQINELKTIRRKLDKVGILKDIKDLPASKAMKAIKDKDPKLHKSIKTHIKKYEWFGMMHMWGEPFDDEKFLTQVNGITDNINYGYTVILNEDLEWLKKHTQKLTYYRNSFAETCAIASYKSLAAVKEAAVTLDLTLDQIRHLTPEELMYGLKGKPIPNKDILNKRINAYGLILENGNTKILRNHELKQYMKKMLPKTSDVIKGRCASKGKVKGKVSIVITPSDIKKVSKGDILAAPETTPDFLPAMHKAAGIITDMGGITGHAAIVSREFGIPCIVGTKHATQVLKDGDTIEMDAIKGIVKLIKSLN